MEMSREIFLQLMISELESMQDSEGQFKESDMPITDILTKLLYDFPVLEDRHLSQLTDFIISLNSPHNLVSFQLSERFLENITYISSSPSYSCSSRQVSALCEAVYVILPVYMLSYDKECLVSLFYGEHGLDVAWDDFLCRVHMLLKSSSVSLLGPVGKTSATLTPALRKESIDGIVSLVSLVVRTVCDALGDARFAAPTDAISNQTTAVTLQEYVSASIHVQLSSSSSSPQPSNSATGQGTLTSPLSIALDIAGHLLFLIRDVASISPATATAAIPPLLDAILLPMTRISSVRSSRSSVKKAVVTEVSSGNTENSEDQLEATVLQVQMMIFFFISQLAGACMDTTAQRLAKPMPKTEDSSWESYRAALVACVARHTSTIVTIAEAITTSLAIIPDMSGAGQVPGGETGRGGMRVKAQIFDSLSTIACFISGNLLDIQGSYGTSRRVSTEDVLLSSRLLSVLMTLGTCRVEGTAALSTSPIADGKDVSSASTEEYHHVLYKLLDTNVQMRYLILIANLSLLYPSSSAFGDGSVSTYAHKLLFPIALRLEFCCPLANITPLSAEPHSATSDDYSATTIAEVASIDYTHCPYLLGSCMGIILNHLIVSNSAARGSAPAICIIDRNFLKTVAALYGDSPTANTCSLAPHDLVVVLLNYILKSGRELSVAARSCGAAHRDLSCHQGDITMERTGDITQPDGSTHSHHLHAYHRHAADKAGKLLLRLLDSCHDMLRMICDYCTRFFAERGGDGWSTVEKDLICHVLNGITSLSTEVGLTCAMDCNGTNGVVLSDSQHEERELATVKTEIISDDGLEMDGEVYINKVLEQQRLLDQRIRKRLYIVVRVAKELRSVLEGQRSSKAD